MVNVGVFDRISDPCLMQDVLSMIIKLKLNKRIDTEAVALLLDKSRLLIHSKFIVHINIALKVLNYFVKQYKHVFFPY